MTTSKVIVLIATIVPFGFVLLACAFILHRLIVARRADKAVCFAAGESV